jgi:hypothetical protein
MLAMHLPGSMKGTILARAVHVLELLAMRLTGSRWKEIRLAWKPLKGTNLANAVYVLRLLAMHLPGSMKGTILARAVHVLRLLAMHLPGSMKGTILARACLNSNCLQCVCQEAAERS